MITMSELLAISILLPQMFIPRFLVLSIAIGDIIYVDLPRIYVFRDEASDNRSPILPTPTTPILIPIDNTTCIYIWG